MGWCGYRNSLQKVVKLKKKKFFLRGEDIYFLDIKFLIFVFHFVDGGV